MMLIERTTRTYMYSLIKSSLQTRRASFEAIHYWNVIDTLPPAIETRIYPSDVSHYLVTFRVGSPVFLIPIVWAFEEAEQQAYVRKINEVMDTNVQSAFHLVFCDPSWTTLLIEEFGHGLAAPQGKRVSVSLLEDWMPMVWRKVHQARLTAIEECTWSQDETKRLLLAAHISEVAEPDIPHAVQLFMPGAQRDAQNDVLASFTVNWILANDNSTIAGEIRSTVHASRLAA